MGRGEGGLRRQNSGTSIGGQENRWDLEGFGFGAADDEPTEHRNSGNLGSTRPVSLPNLVKTPTTAASSSAIFGVTEGVEALVRESLPTGMVDYFLVVGPEVDADGCMLPANYSESGFGSGGIPNNEPEVSGAEGHPPVTSIELQCGILESFPKEQRDDVPFPTKVEWFCFPQGLYITAHKSAPTPRVGSFIRFSSGIRSYGLCLTFYKPVETCQGNKFADEVAPQAGTSQLWVPVCLCVLTHIPVLDSLVDWLKGFYTCMVELEQQRRDDPRSHPPPLLDAAVFQLALEVPLPIPGVCKLSLQAFSHRYSFYLPGVAHLPALSFSLKLLLQCLRPGGVLQLWGAAVQEARILLHSRKLSLLSVVAEGIFSLTYPLQWPYAYVPVLPHILIEHVESPQPFILGIHTDWMQEVNVEVFQDLVVVDCDRGLVHMPLCCDPVPPSIEQPLLSAMRQYLYEGPQDLTGMDERVRLGQSRDLTVQAVLNGQVKPSSGSEVKKKSEAQKDWSLRMTFARAMADMFYGYTDCMFYVVPDRPIFNGSRFLGEYCRPDQCAFLSKVIDTLAFKFMLENQESPSLMPFHHLLERTRKEMQRAVPGKQGRRSRRTSPAQDNPVSPVRPAAKLCIGHQNFEDEEEDVEDIVTLALPSVEMDLLQLPAVDDEDWVGRLCAQSDTAYFSDADPEDSVVDPQGSPEEGLDSVADELVVEYGSGHGDKLEGAGDSTGASGVKQAPRSSRSRTHSYDVSPGSVKEKEAQQGRSVAQVGLHLPRTRSVFDEDKLLSSVKIRKSSFNNSHNTLVLSPVASPMSHMNHMQRAAQRDFDDDELSDTSSTTACDVAVQLQQLRWKHEPLLRLGGALLRPPKTYTLAGVGSEVGRDLAEALRQQTEAVVKEVEANGRPEVNISRPTGGALRHRGSVIMHMIDLGGGVGGQQRDVSYDAESAKFESCLEAVFSSDRIPDGQVEEVERILRDNKSIQQRFLNVLRQPGRRGGSKGPFRLQVFGFETLARFSYTLLCVCVERADYEAAHRILQLTGAYFYVHEGSTVPGLPMSETRGDSFTEFLSARVRRHVIFTDLRFWQQILLQSVNQKAPALKASLREAPDRMLGRAVSVPYKSTAPPRPVSGVASTVNLSTSSAFDSVLGVEEDAEELPSAEKNRVEEGKREAVEEEAMHQLICREVKTLLQEMIGLGMESGMIMVYIQTVAREMKLPPREEAKLQEQAQSIWRNMYGWGDEGEPTLQPLGAEAESSGITEDPNASGSAADEAADAAAALEEQLEGGTEVSPGHTGTPSGISPSAGRGTATSGRKSLESVGWKLGNDALGMTAPAGSGSKRRTSQDSTMDSVLSKLQEESIPSPRSPTLKDLTSSSPRSPVSRCLSLSPPNSARGRGTGGFLSTSPSLRTPDDKFQLKAAPRRNRHTDVREPSSAYKLVTPSSKMSPTAKVFRSQSARRPGKPATNSSPSEPKDNCMPSLLTSIEFQNKEGAADPCHSGPVLCIAAKRNRLATGSSDCTVNVFDLAQVSRVAVLTGHTGPITEVVCDEDWVLSASNDGTMRYWPLKGATPAKRGLIGLLQPQHKFTPLLGHAASVECAQVVTTPGIAGTHNVVSGAGDKQVRLWDMLAGRCKVIFTGHDKAVTCVDAYVRSVQHVLSGSEDCTVRLWDINEGTGCEALRKFSGHESSVEVVKHIDINFGVSGSNDRTLRTWDKRVKGSVGVLRGHTGPVTCACVTAEHTTLISGSADKTVMVWDTRATAKGAVHTMIGHTDRVTSMFLSEGAVYSCSEDSTVREWDWATGGMVNVFKGHSGGISCIAGTERAVATAGWDRSVRMWPRFKEG
ncbi:unnamed protein product [Chrysoparadoxa australica]